MLAAPNVGLTSSYKFKDLCLCLKKEMKSTFNFETQDFVTESIVSISNV
jgi:hypothetical protein